MNTERIRAALSVMGANEECLYKRINRYAKGGDTENLVKAVNKIDRIQECISIIRREIADEIGRKKWEGS